MTLYKKTYWIIYIKFIALINNISVKGLGENSSKRSGKSFGQAVKCGADKRLGESSEKRLLFLSLKNF